MGVHIRTIPSFAGGFICNWWCDLCLYGDKKYSQEKEQKAIRASEEPAILIVSEGFVCGERRKGESVKEVCNILSANIVHFTISVEIVLNISADVVE